MWYHSCMHVCMYFCLYLFLSIYLCMHVMSYELVGGYLPCSIWVRSFVPVSTTMFCGDRIKDHRCGQDRVGRV